MPSRLCSAYRLQMSTDQYSTLRPSASQTLCFLVAVIEGFDLQAAGVAVPLLGPALSLTPGQVGWFFAAATLGLIIGALVGGRIADRHGRRMGLLFALVTFGTFSTATAFAWDFESLFALRLLTGAGLGAALPNLVAIAAEVAPSGRTSSAVATMYAGMPLGGALAALLSILGLRGGWSTIFLVGGLAPVIVIPLVVTYLPSLKPAINSADQHPTAVAALFERGRRSTTAALWVGFFCALLVLYLLLNWLPSLLIARGLGREQAGLAQIGFNVAGAVGSGLVGRAMDGRHRTRVTIASFIALLGTLVLLAAGPSSVGFVLVTCALLGSAVMPVQAILYGLAPSFYAPVVRGVGVGAAVAAGRFGSVAGPLLAGALVAGGRSGGEVLETIIPIAAVAAAGTMWLVTRPPSDQNL